MESKPIFQLPYDQVGHYRAWVAFVMYDRGFLAIEKRRVPTDPLARAGLGKQVYEYGLTHAQHKMGGAKHAWIERAQTEIGDRLDAHDYMHLGHLFWDTLLNMGFDADTLGDHDTGEAVRERTEVREAFNKMLERVGGWDMRDLYVMKDYIDEVKWDSKYKQYVRTYRSRPPFRGQYVREIVSAPRHIFIWQYRDWQLWQELADVINDAESWFRGRHVPELSANDLYKQARLIDTWPLIGMKSEMKEREPVRWQEWGVADVAYNAMVHADRKRQIEGWDV